MKKHFFLFLMFLTLFSLFGNGVQAQTPTQPIKGQVTDAGNEPIIGASIMVKGANNGTITNAEGRFSINATPGAVLVVSYIGYVTQEVKTAGNNR